MPGRAASRDSRTRASAASQSSLSNVSTRVDHVKIRKTEDGFHAGRSLLVMVLMGKRYSSLKKDRNKTGCGEDALQTESIK